mgnify:CR=1 FL=1|jgi:hypothetical protein
MKIRFIFVFILLSGCGTGTYYSANADGIGYNGISRHQALVECKWETGRSVIAQSEPKDDSATKTGMLTRDDCMRSKGFKRAD